MLVTLQEKALRRTLRPILIPENGHGARMWAPCAVHAGGRGAGRLLADPAVAWPGGTPAAP
jgi:hypothetical protein